MVFVTGDPGSGKTALVQEFIRRAMETHGDLIAAQGNSNAQSGVGDPYLPFIEVLQMLTADVEALWLGGGITRQHAVRLWRLLPDVVQALVAAGPELIDRFVLGAALVTRAQTFAPNPERALWSVRLAELVNRKSSIPPAQSNLEQVALFEQYTQVLQTLAKRYPLILALDDLQWADAGSISLLFHLGRRLTGSRILIVGAYRPDDIALQRGGERHPLEPVVNEFHHDWGEISVKLDRAEGRKFVNAILDIEPNRLGAAFRETLYQHTGGHPLFTVESSARTPTAW